MNYLRSPLLKYILLLALLFSLCFGLTTAYGFEELGKYEYNRARLLGYMLRQFLSVHHYSHKEIDDNLSKASFDIYLKQLDVQKQFLLQEDVEKLKIYSDLIDDELNSGRIKLPEAATNIFDKRATQVRQMIKEILSRHFDFSKQESIETDSEKLDYLKTEKELRERWRKILKLQVLHKYLDLMEDETSKSKNVSNAAERTIAVDENLQSSAREKILKRYEDFFSKITQSKENERYYSYFNSITRVFDPHTKYMPPTYKEDFDIHMKGSLEGIGASLREEDGYIKVARIVPGGPAFRQGQLQAEDIILHVGEGDGEKVDIRHMRIRDAVRLIRGKKGTEVRLTVKKPDGSQIVVPIIRDVVQLEDSFAKGTTLKEERSGKTFGYIKLPTFYRDFEKTTDGDVGRNSTEDVMNELKKFESQNISGLILDLRNNSGGALADSVNIAGLFIKTGPIVQVKDSKGKISVLSDKNPEISYTGPIIILVNKFSASASEILAGALQDYGRALIMGGEHTHGKGTVQSIIDLDRNIPFNNIDQYKPLGALKLTTQKFYRISGESTQYRGVVPDIVLPDRWKSLESGEQYLDYALPWDTVSAVPFSKWSLFRSDISALRSKSSERVMSKQDFIDIEMQNKRVIERQNRTIKSLNIDVVRKEREESQRQREKEGEKYHGQTNPENKGISEPLTLEQRRELWINEVSGDIYVQEALAVFVDTISAEPALSMN